MIYHHVFVLTRTTISNHNGFFLFFRAIGLPSQSEWPDVSLPWKSFKKVPPKPLEKYVPEIDPKAKDLLEVSNIQDYCFL